MPETRDRNVRTAAKRVLPGTDSALSHRLVEALRYPLRGAALAAIFIFALGRAVAAISFWPLNWAVAMFVWASAFLYALACLLRSAHGYAEPPEVRLDQGRMPGVVMWMLQVMGIILVVLAARVSPVFWWPILALALLLPAMTLTVAFEDHFLHPRNIANWGRVMAAFGPSYLLPVVLGITQYILVLLALRHGGLLNALIWSLPVMYMVLLNLHVTGVLTYRHHQALGHSPDADVLAQESGRDADDELLQEVDALRRAGDSAMARDRLAQRLIERSAPLRLHTTYRQLLREQNDNAALLQHAQLYIATLMAADDLLRALGVMQECITLDANFMPDDPEAAGAMADAALRAGMPRLALKLSRGYPNHWPGSAEAPRYGLQAALILADHLQQPTEAGVLAAKLAAAYPQHPEQKDIQRLLQRLGMSDSVPRDSLR